MYSRGFAPIFIIAIVLLLSAGSAVYFYVEDTEKEDPAAPSATGEMEDVAEMGAPENGVKSSVETSVASKRQEPNATALLSIEAELKRASQSGGMSPESYRRIESELERLEVGGSDTTLARDLLSRLSVGGKTQKTTTSSAGEPASPPSPSPTPTPPVNTTPAALATDGTITWMYPPDGNKWTPSGDPPPCPALLFSAPVDVSKASSILYPGQQRGKSINDYKAHGGFRFDNQTSNAIEARAPFDGFIWRGNRHIVEGGHIQYGFDLIHECGIMHRFGHLNELSPQLQKVAERLPQPVLNDSRTTDLLPFEFVKKGELLATKIGVPGNPGMDWGAYDLRNENAAAKDPTFREAHKFQRWYDYFGLCWFDYLPDAEEQVARSLPGGDGTMGKQSDYCK